MLLVVIIMLFASVSIAEETMYVNVKYGSYLNARDFPDTQSRLVGRLNRGQSVTIAEEHDGFYKVLFVSGNTSGWVSSEFLSTEKPYEIPVGKYTTTSKVRVREDHSSDSDVVLKLKRGKVVTVKDFFEDDSGIMWAAVNGGYINMEFLEYQP